MQSPLLTAIAAIAVLCGSAAFCQVVDMDQPVVNLVDDYGRTRINSAATDGWQDLLGMQEIARI